ncbi:MAG: futalosine hydrolase [Desulfarculaceae bacterium]|nr:futalosine hydrolase [Desulfarculaceae bacterium]
MPGKILVAAATRREAADLLELSTVKQGRGSDRDAPVRVSINSIPFYLGITGIGSVNTASRLTRFIERIDPGLIIQTGIAGTFRESGLDIGDVAVADREVYIHTGVENPASPYPLDPLPFPLVQDQKETCRGVFHPDLNFSETAQKSAENALAGAGVKVKKGLFITVSTITASRETERLLYKLFTPLAESMEGAAAAQTANLYGIPFVEIRAVSNFVGIRDKSRWNIPRACRNACSACAEVIRSVGGPESPRTG